MAARARPLLSGAFETTARLIFRLWCRLSVSGREHIPSGPFIICSNHQSHVDSVALMAATGRAFVGFGLLAAQDYFFERPLTRRLAAPFLNLIPVARHGDARALQRTMALCRAFVDERQGCLIIYPEGGRSRDGRLRPFKRGAAVFAAELRLPIVPAYVDGSRAVMPPGAVWPRRGRIHVRFGPPILPDAAASPAAGRRFFHQTAADLEQRVIELKAITGV
jgi:1-acyl-sn-glycerol-3-phosphate acyltransferase